MDADFSALDRPEVLMVLFHPRKDYGAPESRPPEAAPGTPRVQDILVPVEAEIAVSARFHLGGRAHANVLFFHGNGEIAADYDSIGPFYNRIGVNFLAVDYRGYGASTGAPSEQGLYRDAEASIRFFNERLRKGTAPVVFWGRSIGAPVAAHGAATSTPDALVLETPFPDVRTLLAGNPVMRFLSLFSGYRFPTSEFLQRYSGPLLVVHGDADTIIPFGAGRQVFDRAPSARKQFVALPGADHNDLHIVNPTVRWRAIDAFIASLARST